MWTGAGCWVAAEVPKSSGQLSVPICVPAPSPLSDGLAGSVPKFWAVTVSVNLETRAFFFYLYCLASRQHLPSPTDGKV